MPHCHCSGTPHNAWSKFGPMASHHSPLQLGTLPVFSGMSSVDRESWSPRLQLAPAWAQSKHISVSDEDSLWASCSPNKEYASGGSCDFDWAFASCYHSYQPLLPLFALQFRYSPPYLIILMSFIITLLQKRFKEWYRGLFVSFWSFFGYPPKRLLSDDKVDTIGRKNNCIALLLSIVHQC
jgi:hypothetical protein